MPQIEASLPDQVVNDIDRLIEQGEFINRDQAFEELLSLGASAYETTDETPSAVDESMFTNVVSDQQDPATEVDQSDEDHSF